MKELQKECNHYVIIETKWEDDYAGESGIERKCEDCGFREKKNHLGELVQGE